MSLLVDIGCPDCGRKTTVRKRGLGQYYCEACDRTFTQADVVPVPDPTRTPEQESDGDTEE